MGLRRGGLRAADIPLGGRLSEGLPLGPGVGGAGGAGGAGAGAGPSRALSGAVPRHRETGSQQPPVRSPRLSGRGSCTAVGLPTVKYISIKFFLCFLFGCTLMVFLRLLKM